MLKIADPNKGAYQNLADAMGYYGTPTTVRQVRSKG